MVLSYVLHTVSLVLLVSFFPSPSCAASAEEEASKISRLLHDAKLNTDYANANETAINAYIAKVEHEFATGHSELEDCIPKMHEKKDIVVQWAQTARTNFPIVQIENANAQAAVSVDDEDAAKGARERAESAANECEDAAQKTAHAFLEARKKYHEVNKAAAEAEKADDIYGEMKILFEVSVREKEKLDNMSHVADVEASPDREGSVDMALKVREEKAEADEEMPQAHSSMDVADMEHSKCQNASKEWNEVAAKDARENLAQAHNFGKERMKKVREAYKHAKQDFYDLKRKESKIREKEAADIIKLRDDLRESLNKLVAAAVDDAESETVIQSFHEMMDNLVQSVETKLRKKIKRSHPHQTTESGNGIDGTSGITAGESLEELMATIFRPLPEEANGSILDENTGTCVSTLEAFRRVYFNQIEILQRGLPTPLLQLHFSKPFALVFDLDDTTCIPYEIVKDYFTADWHLKDTLIYGGLLELDSLEQINGKELPFLSFVSVPSNVLPELRNREIDDIEDLWELTVQAKQSNGGATSMPKDVYFPRTIELIYDNNETTSCTEYDRFGRHNGRDTLDARQATILLFTTSLRLLGMGASKSCVAQMLAHLSAFIFNGVRCRRKEGKDIRVPAELMKAYSVNTARIVGEIISLEPDPKISMEAVEQVYATEINAMTSYDTWGNYYFHAVYPDGHYENAAFLEALFDDGKYNTLISLTGTLNRMLSVGTPNLTMEHTEKQATCGQQFRFESQVVVEENLLESCCAGTCDLLKTLEDCEDLYLVCCKRCNEFLCMSTEIDEMAELPAYDVIVPEYGEREAYAVPIMI